MAYNLFTFAKHYFSYKFIQRKEILLYSADSLVYLSDVCTESHNIELSDNDCVLCFFARKEC